MDAQTDTTEKAIRVLWRRVAGKPDEARLEAISDPGHPKHTDMLEWIGGAFASEGFDAATVNQELAWIR
jgi:hypothetical protein